MIFDKARKPNGQAPVFFIDASSEHEKGTNQNKLRSQDIDKIVTTFHQRELIDRYSTLAPFNEIAENDFNLNIPRYVDTFEPEPEVDMQEVAKEISQLETELAEVQDEMKKHLQELGL